MKNKKKAKVIATKLYPQLQMIRIIKTVFYNTLHINNANNFRRVKKKNRVRMRNLGYLDDLQKFRTKDGMKLG